VESGVATGIFGLLLLSRDLGSFAVDGMDGATSSWFGGMRKSTAFK
jgi:hypothetical protein